MGMYLTPHFAFFIFESRWNTFYLHWHENIWYSNIFPIYLFRFIGTPIWTLTLNGMYCQSTAGILLGPIRCYCLIDWLWNAVCGLSCGIISCEMGRDNGIEMPSNSQDQCRTLLGIVLRKSLLTCREDITSAAQKTNICIDLVRSAHNHFSLD